MKIGIVGGSFDPIHLAHLMIGAEARHRLDLSKVLYIPANVRPHKAHFHSADAKARYAMVKAAVRGCPYFEASDIELRREGVSYTVDTLRALKDHYGSRCRIFFIIGADTISELPTWKDIRQVARLCTFALAMRPGMPQPNLDKLVKTIGRDAVDRMKKHLLDVPLIEISSTAIRERVRQGRNISYMTPRPVEAYILRHRLYRR